jgi:hypothetical protein
MDYSPQMAASLLRRWQDFSTLLVVALSTPQLSLTTAGTITAFELEDGIQISLLAFQSASGQFIDAPGAVTVLLKGATFEYVNSSEAPAEVRDKSVAMLVGVLTIRISDNLVLTLSDIRNQPETEGEGALN